jgi:hypothetical protein
MTTPSASSAPTPAAASTAPDAPRLAEVAQALEASAEWMLHGRRNGDPLLSTPDMVDAARFIRAALAAPQAVPDTLCKQLQRKCCDMGVYWRASDAHGVDVTPDQAAELLREALAVEVNISAPPQEQAEPVKRLIGWRTDNFLHETADPAQAKNWEPHHDILPIFEGDPNTKLAAPTAAAPTKLKATFNPDDRPLTPDQISERLGFTPQQDQQP